MFGGVPNSHPVSPQKESTSGARQQQNMGTPMEDAWRQPKGVGGGGAPPIARFT